MQLSQLLIQQYTNYAHTQYAQYTSGIITHSLHCTFTPIITFTIITIICAVMYRQRTEKC